MKEPCNLIRTLAVSLAVLTFTACGTRAELSAPAQPSQQQLTESLIKGLSEGAGQNCRETGDIAALGSTEQIAALCTQITACIASAIKGSEVLQKEALDAFKKGLPPEPRYIPQNSTMMVTCIETALKPARLKAGKSVKP